MKRFTNILVATDTRYGHHPIVDEAVAIAKHNDCTLTIVDVVPELPWTTRLTLPDHEHMRDLMAKEKKEKLSAMAASIRDQGVDVQTKVLQGKTSVEIIREVLREDYDLVMRVAKGKDSPAKGFFGNTGTRLLRQCPCAVWLVTPTRTQFQHVLGCIDTSSDDPLDEELNSKVLELAKSISHYHGGFYSIVHAWITWNWQMMKSRMGAEAFAEMETANKQTTKKQLDLFLKKHELAVDASNVHLVKGEPADTIPAFVKKNEVDLVVMGTVARSGLSGIVMGNTAERILGQLDCSVLALKPSDFISPIRLD